MIELFKEIVHIMHHDYAGCFDKQGCDRPELFMKQISQLQEKNELTNEIFVQIVKEYLLDFNDKHIHFFHPDVQQSSPSYCGFQVRRYEDELYVTKVDHEARLKIGDVFTGIGGLSIPELKIKHQSLLNESHPERENWTAIFSHYEWAELVDASGGKQPFSLAFYSRPPFVPTYSLQELEGSTILLTMTDFKNPDAITTLVDQHRDLLEWTENWVIDVRVNNGGSDTSYFPLLPYLAPVEGMDSSSEDSMLFHCTEANTERRLADMEEMLQQIEDEEARALVQLFKEETARNKGKGFVEFDLSAIAPDSFIKGYEYPKKVIVLSDTYCGSSGDSFVEACKKSSKVTVIGRATTGLNDYANLAKQTWDEGFVFMYPTSKLSRIDQGNGMTGVGIAPHIHIPWTPKHVHTDVDLEHALALLKLPVI